MHAKVNLAMTIRTDAGDKARIVGTVIGQALNMMWLEIRRPGFGRKRCRRVTVDGADRSPGNSVHIDIGFMDGLINASLINAERAAALKH